MNLFDLMNLFEIMNVGFVILARCLVMNSSTN